MYDLPYFFMLLYLSCMRWYFKPVIVSSGRRAASIIQLYPLVSSQVCICLKADKYRCDDSRSFFCAPNITVSWAVLQQLSVGMGGVLSVAAHAHLAALGGQPMTMTAPQQVQASFVLS